MKALLCIATMLSAVAFFAGVEAGDKKQEEKGVGALPPHGLDTAFEKGRSERDLTNALLNNKLFQKAVVEALKAKQAQELMFKNNPKLAAPSPSQAARQKFIEVIREEMRAEKKPAD